MIQKNLIIILGTEPRILCSEVIRKNNSSMTQLIGHTNVQPMLSAWTYICPTYVVSLDIRMSNLKLGVGHTYVQPKVRGLDIRMSNLKVGVGHTYVQAYEFHDTLDIRMSNPYF